MNRSDRRRTKRQQEKAQRLIKNALMDINVQPGRVYVADFAHDDDCPCLTHNKPLTACICNPKHRVREI